MRITKNQLRQIIKEELAGVLGEADEPEEEEGKVTMDGDTKVFPPMTVTGKPPAKNIVEPEQKERVQATTRNLLKVTGKPPAEKEKKGKKK